jgi:hypothetical protein
MFNMKKGALSIFLFVALLGCKKETPQTIPVTFPPKYFTSSLYRLRVIGTNPPTIGTDILDGKFNGAEISFVDPQATRDSLVLPPQAGYNQMLQTGNEYQQVPGYGKLAKVFQAFSGGMG